MNFDFSDEQQMLRDQARRLLRETCNFNALRERLDQGEQVDLNLWRQMAELGWLAVAIPEEQGGLGLGVLELCVLAEELGRTLAPVPFHGTLFTGAEILKRSMAPEAADWLARIAVGDAFLTVQLTLDWSDTKLQWHKGQLNGRTPPLAYAAHGDAVIVPALDQGEPVVALVELERHALQVAAATSVDQAQPHGIFTFDNTPAVLLARGDEARLLMREIVDQDAILTAFEQIGGADAACNLTRDYALERHTFGRPIGSYQAVKHKLADMAVAIELARSNAWFGAWAMHAGETIDQRLAAAASRVSATQAFEYAARECLHLHGGIGYTWEADCHFFFKRSRLLAMTLGQPGIWVDQLLAAHSLAPLHTR